MGIANRRASRPLVEAIEERIAASSGLGHPVQAASAHHRTPPPKHHAAPGPASHAKAPATPRLTVTNVTVVPVTITNVTNVSIAPPTIPTYPSHPPTVSTPPTGASDEAWVKLVNMTGQDLQYQIRLGPYANGRFLPFDIAANGPNSVQERYSSLIVDGHREEPSFAIRFGNGPVIPLNTGISARAAQGYYIFLDSNLNYYLAPFVGGTNS